MDENGIVIKNKARLVAQSYNQQEGIDYEETFASVVRLETIKTFFAYAAYMDFMVYQMDVKSAFLNEKISKEVYVQQPSGFESSEYPNHVCKLDKALYGLKQAPRSWRLSDTWRKVSMLEGKEVPIFCGSTSAIAISNNIVLHSRTRHVDIRALTLQPIAMYVEYLKGFWYIAEVEEKTKTITFLLSCNDLTLVKPHTIIVASFQKPLASEVPLTSYMLKVAKLSEEPEQSLLPPSGEVNADDTTNKSLSRASIQPVIQSKATTDLKTKKKKIPPSSKPKSPYKVRLILLKKQVAETQHAKVTVATADATKSLEAFELAEEQGNQPSTIESVKALIVGQSPHEYQLFLQSHVWSDLLAQRYGGLPDHMDHICEEVSSLHSRLGDIESSIVQQLLKDSIKSSISKSITEELPYVEARVKKNLQDQLPNLLLKPMYKEFNAFNKLESQRFVLLKKELSKYLHKNMKKSIRLKGEQPSAQVILNEKAIVVHNPEEKKEGTISMKGDSDDDDLDKQPYQKDLKS
nr:retrovirus-related Pol polyprotein from transposon TNT 1-94 [Tanacetum cinerariifolium]